MKKKTVSAELDVLDIITKEIGKVEKTLERVDEFYRKDLRKLDRLSDWIAEFGGSWKFISLFMLVLLAWVVVNTWILLEKPFDPFPFILLNLFLSMIAALQALAEETPEVQLILDLIGHSKRGIARKQCV